MQEMSRVIFSRNRGKSLVSDISVVVTSDRFKDPDVGIFNCPRVPISTGEESRWDRMIIDTGIDLSDEH